MSDYTLRSIYSASLTSPIDGSVFRFNQFTSLWEPYKLGAGDVGADVVGAASSAQGNAEVYADLQDQSQFAKSVARAVIGGTTLANLFGPGLGATYGYGVLIATSGGVIGTQDGVTDLATNDIVMIPFLTGADRTSGGPYKVLSPGAGPPKPSPVVLRRTTDFDADAKIKEGCYVFIHDGASLHNKGRFYLENRPPLLLDTTQLVWVWCASTALFGGELSVGINFSTVLAGETKIGGHPFTPARYARVGLTTVLTFEAEAYMTNAGTTGLIYLYDQTGSLIATLTFPPGTTTETILSTAVALPTVPTSYYATAKVTGGDGVLDTFKVESANIVITYTP